MDGWVNEWMNEWMNERVKDWLTDWTNEWINKRINERMTGWTTEWMIKWMKEWVSNQLIEATVRNFASSDRPWRVWAKVEIKIGVRTDCRTPPTIFWTNMFDEDLSSAHPRKPRGVGQEKIQGRHKNQSASLLSASLRSAFDILKTALSRLAAVPLGFRGCHRLNSTRRCSKKKKRNQRAHARAFLQELAIEK